LVVLEIQDVRPQNLDAARANTFLQRQLGFCFEADSRLRLIVKRAIEATRIEVQADHAAQLSGSSMSLGEPLSCAAK
jgi:hypothetical protein